MEAAPCWGMHWAPVKHCDSKGDLLLLLKWKDGLRVVCVPSAGPSSLPLPAVPGECCALGEIRQSSLGSGVWECSSAGSGAFFRVVGSQKADPRNSPALGLRVRAPELVHWFPFVTPALARCMPLWYHMTSLWHRVLLCKWI